MAKIIFRTTETSEIRTIKTDNSVVLNAIMKSAYSYIVENAITGEMISAHHAKVTYSI